MNIPENINISKYELIIHSNCNLRCTYCFDGYKSERNIYEFDKYKMNIDIIPDLFNFFDKASKNEFEVVLFGGEPLLNWNFFEFFVIESKKRFGNRITISTVTNGTLLNSSKIDFITHHNIGVLFSLDGIKESNMNRINKNGDPSWESAVKNLPELISKSINKKIQISMVINKNNYHLLYESYSFLSKLNVQVQLLFNYHEYFDDYIIESIEKDLFKIIENNIDLPIFFKKVMSKNYLKDNSYCGSANNTISINYLGDLYFCHQFIPVLSDKKGKYIYGNIHEGYTNENILKIFNERTSFNILKENKEMKCNTCEANYWCKGGCIAEHYSCENSNDIYYINNNICRLHTIFNKFINKVKN